MCFEFFVVFICCLMQVKDEVNAGSLLFKLGKVEFENVYFSYTNGLVYFCVDFFY